MNTEQKTNIVPVEQSTTKIITSFKVFVNSVDLFEKAKIRVQLFDTNNNFVKMEFLEMSGEDYNNWGSDDNYIINYVAQKYGFTVQP